MAKDFGVSHEAAVTSALRVLMMSDVSPVDIKGGAERVLWEQASRLAAVGHQVHLLSRSPADGVTETIERQGVRIAHFPADRRSFVRFLLGSIREARQAAARELTEAGADVLHLQQPLSAFGVLSSAASRRIPSLYTFHSPAPLEYRSRRGTTAHHPGGLAGSLGTGLLWLLEGFCLRRASRVHVLSDFSAGLLRKLYRIRPERIVKIPGGVDTERFRPAEDRDAVRKGLGVGRAPERGDRPACHADRYGDDRAARCPHRTFSRGPPVFRPVPPGLDPGGTAGRGSGAHRSRR